MSRRNITTSDGSAAILLPQEILDQMGSKIGDEVDLSIVGRTLVVRPIAKAMKKGAFALIDCLGWKGIWQRSSESALIEKLERIQDEVKAVEDKFNSQHCDMPIKAQILLISDTVAISIQYENDESLINNTYKSYLVRAASLSVVGIQKLFLAEKPRIVLRGCITYGDHVVVKNFIIGPAVDEAANYYEIAEGALVWLHRSAGIHYSQANLLQDDIHSLFIPYDMPLKTGARLKSLVLNPLYLENSADGRRVIIEGYLEAMQGVDRIDVWLKGQNTLDFLQTAESVAAELEQKIKGLK